MAFTNLNTIHIPSTGAIVPASWGDAVNDNFNFLFPPMKVVSGQTGAPYYWQGGVTSVGTDGFGNFSVVFPTAFSNAIVTGWVQSASGGTPFGVAIGVAATNRFDCHASSLESSVVVSTTLTVIYGALGW